MSSPLGAPPSWRRRWDRRIRRPCADRQTSSSACIVGRDEAIRARAVHVPPVMTLSPKTMVPDERPLVVFASQRTALRRASRPTMTLSRISKITMSSKMPSVLGLAAPPVDAGIPRSTAASSERPAAAVFVVVSSRELRRTSPYEQCDDLDKFTEHRSFPCQRELAYIAFVNNFQRTVTLGVISGVVIEPVVRARVQKHHLGESQQDSHLRYGAGHSIDKPAKITKNNRFFTLFSSSKQGRY